MARMETVRCYTVSDIRRIERKAAKRAIRSYKDEIKLRIGLGMFCATPFLAVAWWVVFGY